MQRYRGIILSEPLDQYIRVFFLGTGGPHISKIRHSIATLIYVNRQWLLFDIGRATLQRCTSILFAQGIRSDGDDEYGGH